MRLTITHQTSYTYDKPVPFALQELRLWPVESAMQRVHRWEISLEGAKPEVDFVDQHGNQVQLVSVVPKSQRVSVRCEGEVETFDTNGVAYHNSNYAPIWLFRQPTRLTTPGPGIGRLLRRMADDPSRSVVARLHELSAIIRSDVRYELGHTTAASTAEEVLAGGRGVCQDHAHVFIAAARRLGSPARYVSGYLMMNDRIDQDATHAWAEAWVEDLGWVGFDISNGISPDERYVRIASGLDYNESAPTTGVRWGDASETLTVDIQVQQQ